MMVLDGRTELQRARQLFTFHYGRVIGLREARGTVKQLGAELERRNKDLAALKVEFDREIAELRALLDETMARILHLQAIEAALCEPRDGPLH